MSISPFNFSIKYFSSFDKWSTTWFLVSYWSLISKTNSCNKILIESIEALYFSHKIPKSYIVYMCNNLSAMLVGCKHHKNKNHNKKLLFHHRKSFLVVLSLLFAHVIHIMKNTFLPLTYYCSYHLSTSVTRNVKNHELFRHN